MLPSTPGRGVGGSSGFVDTSGSLIPSKPSQSGAVLTPQPQQQPSGNMMMMMASSSSSSPSSSQPAPGFHPAAPMTNLGSPPVSLAHRSHVMAAPPPAGVVVDSMMMGGRLPPQAPPVRAPAAPLPYGLSAPPPVPFGPTQGFSLPSPQAPPPPPPPSLPPPPPPHQMVSFAPTGMAPLRPATTMMNYRAASDEKSVCSSTTGLSFLSSASSAVGTSASSHKRRREQMTTSSSSLAGGAGGGGAGLGTAPSFATDAATQEDLEDDFYDEAEDLVEVDVYTGGGGGVGGSGGDVGMEPMQSHHLEDAEFNSADEDDDLDIDAIIENLDKEENLVTTATAEGAGSDKDSDAATYRDCRATAPAITASPPKPTRIRRKHRRRGSSGGRAPLRRSLKRMRIHAPSGMGFDGSGSLSSSSSLSTLSTRTVGTAKMPPPGASDEEDSLPDAKLPAMDTAEETTDYGSFNRILGGLHAERRMRHASPESPAETTPEPAPGLQRQSSLSSASSGARSLGTAPPTRTVRLPYHSQIY